jgi:hypothetical protein
MKKYIWMVIVTIFALSACTAGRTTESKGLENQAYLQFTIVKGSADKYSDGVYVYVDNNAPFNAKVNLIQGNTVKGDVYVIKTGKRHVKVVYRDNVLFEKDVMLGTQETRKIQLP